MNKYKIQTGPKIMKTTDLFKLDRSAKKLNESLAKTFGRKLNLEAFDMPQLEDARNKLRTQIHTARSQSGFNETVENEALTQSQWMLDAINAEIAEREEFIADSHNTDVSYEEESIEDTSVAAMSRVELLDYLNTTEEKAAGMSDEELRDAANERSQDYAQDNIGEAADSLEEEVIKLLKRFEENAMEIGAYGDPDINEVINHLKNGDAESAAEVVWYSYADQDGGEVPQIEPYVDDLQTEFEVLAQGNNEPVDNTDDGDALASAGHGSDEDYGTFPENVGDDHVNKDVKMKRMGAKPLSTLDKLKMMPRQMKAMVQGDSEDDLVNYNKMKAKRNEAIEGDDLDEVAPPGAKAERMVKHIKKGYAKDGKLTDKEKGIAYATAWKQHNKNESIEGDNMATLNEGEIQQAQSIVTAKTMVDRVGRWIEELSGMENDTLLQLGDQIRDEQGQEAAKMFISSVAPAIQQALENLKSTREALASGVRTLTGEEQSAGMLGAEPEAAPADDFGGEAEPDAMNAEVPAGDEEVPADDFAAAEPAAGGLGDAGRAKRESIERSNSLLKVLAG